MMTKPFSTRFKLDSKIIALIYICYKYNFPLCFMLSFYEMYGEHSLFALKAMTCAKKLTLNDNTFTKIIEESRDLYKQVLTGVSTIIEINKIEKSNENRSIEDKKEIPEYPQIDTSKFSSDYKDFIEQYLLKNIKNIYSPMVELRMSTKDLYEELRP